jgi:subtilisin family serine protease
MKFSVTLFFVPFLLLGQMKAKKFSLPTGITTGQYASGHVLVKVKSEHKALFVNPGVQALKGAPIITKPIIDKKLIARNKSRLGPRLSKSKVDIELFYQVDVSGGDVERFINELYASGYFEWVEPDYVAQLHFSPNDPSTTSQYYLDRIKAYEGWNTTKGSEDVIIGIVDSGGDLDHPDLASQLFTNVNDPEDGIDNDNDGYVDNYQGWDFIGSDTLNINIPNFIGDNNPGNPNGGLGSHGTAVAGCAAAATDNNFGIAGVGFKSKILFTKHAADNQGSTKGGIYRGYEGILYMASHGAKIINCSWGGSFRSQIAQDIITYVTLELGSLVVASAGNNSSQLPSYPAAYDHVLSVAASNQDDIRATFSNYGPTVDIIAPGQGILTTFFNNTFLAVDGTSFSAPITAGAAALVLAHFPDFTPVQVAEQLRITADETFYDKNQGFLYNLGKGMLDISKALTSSMPSIRVSNPRLVNANGSVAEPGQEAFLYMDFTNHLANTTAGISVEITPLIGTPVTISKKKINPGLIASGATVNNKLNPFKLTINATAPTNTTVNFLVNFSDGEYTDYQFISFLVNPSFLDIDDNAVLTTLASNGRIGFENTTNQTNGSGFVFNDNKLLFGNPNGDLINQFV